MVVVRFNKTIFAQGLNEIIIYVKSLAQTLAYGWKSINRSCFYIYIYINNSGPHPWHVENPRLGVKSEIQLLAYTTATATAMRDPSRVCDLHHSSRQCQMADPLSEARDQTRFLMDTSQIHFRCATTGMPCIFITI